MTMHANNTNSKSLKHFYKYMSQVLLIAFVVIISLIISLPAYSVKLVDEEEVKKPETVQESTETNEKSSEHKKQIATEETQPAQAKQEPPQIPQNISKKTESKTSDKSIIEWWPSTSIEWWTLAGLIILSQILLIIYNKKKKSKAAIKQEGTKKNIPKETDHEVIRENVTEKVMTTQRKTVHLKAETITGSKQEKIEDPPSKMTKKKTFDPSKVIIRE